MDKKQRILDAIRFKKIDRIPTTFRATDVFAKRLLDHFKIDTKKPLKETYKELLKLLEVDFWSTGSKIDKFHTVKPNYTGPKPKPPYVADSQLFYTIGINTIIGKETLYNSEHEIHGENPPLGHIEDEKEIKEGFLTSKLNDYDFNTVSDLYPNEKKDDYFICIGSLSSLFMMCCYLMGMENFLMFLSFNRKLAEKLIHEIGEFAIEFNRMELENYSDHAEYYGTWDDVAGQNGLMFNPEIFKKYFLPIYEKMIEQVKKYNLVFGWHCCGSVNEILPDIIDAGIDVFDVVQTSAKGMGIENIYKLYGKEVCLHGGIDIQDLLVKRSSEEVRKEVKRIKELWGNSGGIILAPSHMIVPECPIENVLALYDELNRS